VLYIDPMALFAGVVLLVAFVLLGSRFFPEDVPLHLWHYEGPGDRPSPGDREEDDVRFDWSQREPGGSADDGDNT